MADVRDASILRRPCRTTSRGEKSHATVDDGIHRPSVVRLDATDNVSVALSSRVAFSAVTD